MCPHAPRVPLLRDPPFCQVTVLSTKTSTVLLATREGDGAAAHEPPGELRPDLLQSPRRTLSSGAAPSCRPHSSLAPDALPAGTQPQKGTESWRLVLAFCCTRSRPVSAGLVSSGDAQAFSWQVSNKTAPRDCWWLRLSRVPRDPGAVVTSTDPSRATGA